MDFRRKGKPMSDNEKSAKMSVVEAMRKMAEDQIGGKLKDLKKVTVASDSKDGLEKGLDKAKEMLDRHPEDEESQEQHDPEMEDHESETADEVASEPEMSEDELNEKLEELMKLKEKMKSRA